MIKKILFGLIKIFCDLTTTKSVILRITKEISDYYINSCKIPNHHELWFRIRKSVVNNIGRKLVDLNSFIQIRTYQKTTQTDRYETKYSF